MVTKFPIKLVILKKKVFDTTTGWNRYYMFDKVLLTENSKIKTEAQLCFYIFRRFGDGRYMVKSFMNGQKGFRVYWLGNLTSHGFIRDVNKNKEVENLRGMIAKADSYEERELIEEEIDMEKEISAMEKKSKKRGPLGITKYRPGVMHPYEPIV